MFKKMRKETQIQVEFPASDNYIMKVHVVGVMLSPWTFTNILSMACMTGSTSPLKYQSRIFLLYDYDIYIQDNLLQRGMKTW
jgi:hypothetical protein